MNIRKFIPFLSFALCLVLFLEFYGFSTQVSAAEGVSAPVKMGIASKYNGWVYVNQQNYNYKLSRISKSNNTLYSYDNVKRYKAIIGDYIYYSENNNYNLSKLNINTNKSQNFSDLNSTNFLVGSNASYLFFSEYTNGLNNLISINIADSKKYTLAERAEFITTSDGFVYYYIYDDNDYIKGKLYRSKPNGTETNLVSDSRYNIVSTQGNKIYYTKFTDVSYLYENTLDGKHEKKLFSYTLNSPYAFQRSDSWLYYNRYDTATGLECLFRLNLDQPTQEYLVLKNISLYSVYKDDIYYQNKTDGNKLYKIKSDGTSIQKVSDSIVASNFTITENDIFFVTYESNSGLIAIDSTGAKKKVIDGIISNVNLYDNYVYYLNDMSYLCKTKLDDGVTTVLVKDPINVFRIDGEYIYFNSKFNTDKMKRIKIDGSTSIQTMNSTFPATFSYTYANSDFEIIDGFIYYYKLNEDFTQRTMVRSELSDEDI
ncbi:MAG: DUF5050 domain-containing protein [Ruminiclostridium sp.]